MKLLNLFICCLAFVVVPASHAQLAPWAREVLDERSAKDLVDFMVHLQSDEPFTAHDFEYFFDYNTQNELDAIVLEKCSRADKRIVLVERRRAIYRKQKVPSFSQKCDARVRNAKLLRFDGESQFIVVLRRLLGDAESWSVAKVVASSGHNGSGTYLDYEVGVRIGNISFDVFIPKVSANKRRFGRLDIRTISGVPLHEHPHFYKMIVEFL